MPRVNYSNGATTQWPEWSCKNSCGRKFPEDTNHSKCPDCLAPLIRWKYFEQKTK